ncbi:MAG: trypsin-like peptidase domain-containing protein [Myxococcales bacterium]|nr:trypsin-like peptidase domain-containing protein [Myxococcales bacterium]
MDTAMVRIALSLASLSLVASSPAPAQPATRESLALPSLAPLIESVKAAVVNVDVQSRGRGGEGGEELMERFFRGREGMRERLMPGAGSGFIIDSKGLVLTNNHVVDRAVTIRVRLDDGRSFDAQVLGRDPLTDVALLKLKGEVKDLPLVKLGDSDAMRVGDWVVAIGNPFGLASSVSMGIISARARDIKAGPYDEFLQTDAAINPGNSGGPLFNMKGEVIGINTIIIGGLGTGVGFAVPSNLARALLPQLQKEGSVTRGWLGIGIQDLTADLAKGLGVPVNEGAIVTQVNPGSPAHKSGLSEDDAVVAVDGEKVTSGGALSRTIALKRPESTVRLSVYRGGKQKEVPVKLGTRPDLEGIGSREREEKPSEQQQRIGLVFQDMDSERAEASGLPQRGALITDVLPGSPAERADLRPGMLVVEAAGKAVRSADDLISAIRSAKSGSTLLLRVHMAASGGKLLRALRLP